MATAAFITLGGPLMAQTSPRPTPAPSRPAAPPAPAPVAAPAAAVVTPAAAPAPAPAVVAEGTVVQGFRSAKFGMTEIETMAAILADFSLKGDAIRVEDNPAELTRALVISVPDLLEGGGRADVAYVFGYKTKQLIQVGLTWSKATDDKMTPEKLFSNANVLRAHFLSAGYLPETIATNAVINGGLMMFRGGDVREHTTVLLLQGQFREGESNQRLLTPSGVVVYYIADAKRPDIFKLPAGTF